MLNKIKQIINSLKKKPLVLLGLIFAVGLGGMYLFSSLAYKPVVFERSTPNKGATAVSVSSYIDIYFKNPVSEENRSKIYIRFLPGVSANSKWIAKNHLRLFPEGELIYGQEYAADVLYDGNVLTSFSFSTANKENASSVQLPEISKEDMVILTEDALDVAKGIENLRADHPWYFDLPVLDKRYAIVFNNKRNQFRISIYTKGLSEQEQKATLDIAVQRLTSIVGVDAVRYGYYVFYNDEYTPAL